MSSGDAAQLTLGPAPAQEGAAIEVRCAGMWTVHGIPPLERQLDTLPWPATGAFVIDGSAIALLDTSGAWLLHRTIAALDRQGRTVRLQGLRPEFGALLQLIASREILGEMPAAAAPGRLARLGAYAWSGVMGSIRYLSFVGETFVRLLRAPVRRSPRTRSTV